MSFLMCRKQNQNNFKMNYRKSLWTNIECKRNIGIAKEYDSIGGVYKELYLSDSRIDDANLRKKFALEKFGLKLKNIEE